jgi:drug/metabolite transporter, DME family
MGKNLDSKKTEHLMKALSNKWKGVFFAICAAALNGTIGSFSKILIQSNISPSWIALLKTVLGFIIVFIFLITTNRKDISSNMFSLKYALPSFFGIFCLFFFETHSYESMGAANAVIILMSCGAFSAIIFSRVLLKESFNKNQFIGFIFSIVGISIVLGLNSNVTLNGTLFSMLAGCGYGLFTVLLKKNNTKGGLSTTLKLLFWGSIFLYLPIHGHPIELTSIFNLRVFPYLLGLALFPSILGFFFTTKAVDLIAPANVQLIELSEPIFAAIFAAAFLGESLTLITVVGSMITGIGVYISAIR